MRGLHPSAPAVQSRLGFRGRRVLRPHGPQVVHFYVRFGASTTIVSREQRCDVTEEAGAEKGREEAFRHVIENRTMLTAYIRAIVRDVELAEDTFADAVLLETLRQLRILPETQASEG